MSTVSKELVNLLKNKTPKGKNTVDVLMDIVPVSREAAYRRLRGDIDFSLEESISICKWFNISLDQLAGIGQKGTYTFYMDSVFSERPLEEYSKMLHKIINGIRFMRQDANCFALRAQRTLPPEFLFRYNSLSKVNIHILLSQLYLQSPPSEVLESDIPDTIFPLQKNVSEEMNKVDSVLIIDKKVFVDFIGIIKYFQFLDVISQEEMLQIKKDLLLMLDDMELCASIGKSLEGAKLDMYICNVSFDSTYSYMEGYGYRVSAFGVYCINHIASEDLPASDTHKRWIKSLIRFSNLISASGELYRNEFFYEQRNYVNSML